MSYYDVNWKDGDTWIRVWGPLARQADKTVRSFKNWTNKDYMPYFRQIPGVVIRPDPWGNMIVAPDEATWELMLSKG